MPDITMCKKKDCPKRFQCYRWVARPNEWQSYFIEDEQFEKQYNNGDCAHFWKLEVY